MGEVQEEDAAAAYIVSLVLPNACTADMESASCPVKACACSSAPRPCLALHADMMQFEHAQCIYKVYHSVCGSMCQPMWKARQGSDSSITAECQHASSSPYRAIASLRFPSATSK